jgi:hypothetical protein
VFPRAVLQLGVVETTAIVRYCLSVRQHITFLSIKYAGVGVCTLIVIQVCTLIVLQVCTLIVLHVLYIDSSTRL